MALPVKLVALLASGAVAASAAAYFAMAPSTGSGAGDGSGSAGAAAETSPAAQGEDRLLPCVAPDGILHASTSSGLCLPGHRKLELEDEDDGTCELCDPYEDENERSERESEIEARIEALEKTAYFEVVDKNDRVIFRVGPEGARLFDARSNPVADLGASAAGGWLTLRSGDAEVSLAATGSSGMRIREGGVERLGVGSDKGGPYAFGVSSPTSMIAGIGQSRAGGGAVVVGTPAQLKATLTINDGRGMVTVFKNSSKDGGALTEAKIGGGLLDLGLGDGNSAVRMGHNGNRYGIVLAGPVLGLPLIPRSGLPGSYFMGCASGERPACVASIAGGN